MMSGANWEGMPEEYSVDDDTMDMYQQGFRDGWAAAMDYFMPHDQSDPGSDEQTEPMEPPTPAQ